MGNTEFKAAPEVAYAETRLVYVQKCQYNLVIYFSNEGWTFDHGNDEQIHCFTATSLIVFIYLNKMGESLGSTVS